MQEAFLRLQIYCADRKVEHTEAFMVRTILNLSAEKGRHAKVARTAVATIEALRLDSSPAPEDVLAGRERLRHFELGLQRLGPRSREAFLLNRHDGYSYLQISQRLEISVSMVEKHIARATFFLRDWMTRSER